MTIRKLLQYMYDVHVPLFVGHSLAFLITVASSLSQITVPDSYDEDAPAADLERVLPLGDRAETDRGTY
jgi:hypothetical protein